MPRHRCECCDDDLPAVVRPLVRQADDLTTVSSDGRPIRCPSESRFLKLSDSLSERPAWNNHALEAGRVLIEEDVEHCQSQL